MERAQQNSRAPCDGNSRGEMGVISAALCHARALLSAVHGLVELRCGGSILLMRKREGDVRPITRIHVGYWSAPRIVLLSVAAGSRLHQDVAKRSGQGVAPCCGGSSSSRPMISLHKIKSSRDLKYALTCTGWPEDLDIQHPQGLTPCLTTTLKCGRVKTSRQWRYSHSLTAESREERPVSLRPWLSSKQCSLRP